MNDGFYSFDGALTQPLRVAPAWPEGFNMNLRVTVTIKVEIAISVLGLTALLWLLS
jgi:hypothetical protein